MRSDQPTRRNVVAASAAVLSAAAVSRSAFAAGGDNLKIGLVGIGGRGSGAIVQAVKADSNVSFHAVADLFEDRLERGLANVTKSIKDKTRIDVPKDRRFTGIEGYKQVVACCDVVLLATPPHFRPAQLRHAIEQGKHVFAEKPVAVDGPGVRHVLESAKLAAKKSLSLVSGLCWRYHTPKRELFNRIHEGQIGDIRSIYTSYHSGGVWDPRAQRKECKHELEYQMRNWYYYAWLSGDHIVEQAVHAIDKMGWAMKDVPPLNCTAVGGRTVRTGAEYGNIYDHFGVVYEYANGIRAHHTCRHWKGTAGGVKDYIVGSRGVADVFDHSCTGENAWKFRGDNNDMYQTEHDELFAAIRSGKPINNGSYMATSSLLAIMGRMAAYTGNTVTWDQALNSNQTLGPADYNQTNYNPDPVPVPGVTKFA